MGLYSNRPWLNFSFLFSLASINNSTRSNFKEPNHRIIRQLFIFRKLQNQGEKSKFTKAITYRYFIHVSNPA